VPEDPLEADRFPSSHDWGYKSEPGVLWRSIPVPRAKVIGGSTAHNGSVAGPNQGTAARHTCDIRSVVVWDGGTFLVGPAVAE
jgi:hypothetical protein